jgi:hypothetical protein
MKKTVKRNPWKGWKQDTPNVHERTVMRKKCGKKCFLGPDKSFPICKKGTCRVSKKGVCAAYIRSSQYRNKYPKISQTARRLCNKKK